MQLLETEVQVIDERLRAAEDRVRELKLKLGITSYEDRAKFLGSEIARLERELSESEVESAQVAGRLAALKGKLSSYPAIARQREERQRDPTSDELNKQLSNAELELLELRAKYLEDSRLVQSKKAEIEHIRRAIADRSASVVGVVTSGPSQLYEQSRADLLGLEVRLSELTSRRKMLRTQLDAYRGEADQLSRHSAELNRLERQIPVDAESAKYYRKRLEEARVMEILDREGIVNVRVIAPARASMEPVKPRKLLLTGLAAAVGLIGGLGFAFIADYLDPSIRQRHEVGRYLGMPLLGSIRDFG